MTSRALQDYLMNAPPGREPSPYERAMALRERGSPGQHSVEYTRPEAALQARWDPAQSSSTPRGPDGQLVLPPDPPEDSAALARHREALRARRGMAGMDAYGGQGAGS